MNHELLVNWIQPRESGLGCQSYCSGQFSSSSDEGSGSSSLGSGGDTGTGDSGEGSGGNSRKSNSANGHIQHHGNLW